MEEIVQKKSETTIMDIVRLILSKIKILIIVLFAGVVLGAGFGYLQTHDVKYFGTELKFYINPHKDAGDTVNSDSQYGVYGAYGKNVMNNMVELLSSEAFAEKLLLDENGFPVNNRIATVNNEQLNKDEKATKTALSMYTSYKTEILDPALTVLTEKTQKLNKLWSDARKTDSHLSSTPQTGISSEIDQAIEEEYTAKEAYNLCYEQAKVLADNLEETREKMLETWRTVDRSYYTSKLNSIVSSVRYSYYDETTKVNVDDLARSFIYVNISVLNNEEHAKELRLLLIDCVPEYIEEKMPVPSGYDGTNCIRISRTDEVHQTNSGVVTKTAAKYGLLLGGAGLLIAAIIIIIVDRSDKRLRSIEQITDVFNVPVLGVIPTFKNSQRAEDEPQGKDKEENGAVHADKNTNSEVNA